ncbi:MAG: endolytic transglycosylase MltG [Neisseriaceae bacterium]|nr:MAG: endolytic transglycosylase MltG [Neisseriaceae bacterium]
MPLAYKSTHPLIKTFLIAFLLLVVYWGYEVFFPRNLPANPYRIVVSKGESASKIARQLESDNVISSPRLFVLVSRMMGKDKKITAGMYILHKPLSLIELVERLSNGKPDEISITILDGWNFKQIRNILNSESQIAHLTESMTESQILATLKVNYPRMEGLIYPSTYFIAPGQSDLEVMQHGYKLMQDKLTEAWQSKNKNALYSNPYQLLIMASLIQKETNDPADMVQISTVFNNRLRSNMRLQDDPAVFYGLGNRDKITRADFAIDTPYNTYMHNGLPPTPISTPSQKALDAAAAPSDDYKLLYFIAIGNGKSKFSTSFEEHSKAVDKYLKKK